MRIKGTIVTIGIMALVVIGAACGNGEAASNETEATGTSVNTAPSGAQVAESREKSVQVAPSVGVVSGVSGAPAFSGTVSAVSNGGQAGIWVSGEGSVALEPDLALLNIGVEATAATVAEARAQAAEAMGSIVRAVKTLGLADRDIQTRSFNIFPQYDREEVVIAGRRTGRQVLVGYRVSNTATIKIRDLEEIGTIIDDVAEAGGDATRINGINFTIEDPKPFMTSLREVAVADALAKAQQFASLTQVTLGRLVFITEAGGGVPVVKDFARQAFAEGAVLASSPTSISGGELELRMTVQAVFAIQ